MAKAIKLYSGNNSCGTPVEVAQRADGVWFVRFREYNGYGMGWSKWSAREVQDPVFPAKVRRMVDDNGPEYADIPENQRHLRLEFGFTTLRLVPGQNRLRLPDAEKSAA